MKAKTRRRLRKRKVKKRFSKGALKICRNMVCEYYPEIIHRTIRKYNRRFISKTCENK